MKYFYRYFLPLLLITLFGSGTVFAQKRQKRHQLRLIEESMPVLQTEQTDTFIVTVRDLDELLQSLPEPKIKPTAVNKSFVPKVFSGYHYLRGHKFKVPEMLPYEMLTTTTMDTTILLVDIFDVNDNTVSEQVVEIEPVEEEKDTPQYDILIPGKLPDWLFNSMSSYRFQEDFLYQYLIDNPMAIEYAYWDLPIPPTLYPDDYSFKGYIKRLNLPEVNLDNAVIPETELKKKHWLHTVGSLLQFSQAFVSPNWYQGGNNALALLFNFNWGVQLNQVYHPNILFQSNLSYKLTLSSTPKGSLHKYIISDDVLQYNLNTGLKAFKKWYYSLNMLFKTQLLQNFEENSYKTTASFLSPGELNIGLGMAYTHENKPKTFQITATISPLSYNLVTCISNKIDHNLYNISQNRKTKSEIGSNLELNMKWAMSSNVSYKTRLFAFSDYNYFLGDWENTFSFQINRFLSTQIYVHLRYDTSSEKNTSWKTFMMREILSFGLSYTFSTKP